MSFSTEETEERGLICLGQKTKQNKKTQSDIYSIHNILKS